MVSLRRTASAAGSILAMVMMPLSGASATPHSGPADNPNASGVAACIAEAADRFGVPVAWLEQVMRVESGGVPTARSRAGAIGLMQIMPATYANLRDHHGLGADPWQPRDNILAGAAYLRQLFDRYGSPGFLAAYNAGPARWEAYVAGAKPLPSETIRYLARLGFAAPGFAAQIGPVRRTPVTLKQVRETVFVALKAEGFSSNITALGGDHMTPAPSIRDPNSIFAAVNDVPAAR